MLRKLLTKKPPDNLVWVFERIYVFDCCFSTGSWEHDYKAYAVNVISQYMESNPESSVMILDFREGEKESKIASALLDYDITIIDYPQHYEGCPLLSLEVIHHFLKSTESWLSAAQQNILILHSQPGSWPLLSFVVAAFSLYKKHSNDEIKALDMVYKQAPKDLLPATSSLPSQLRYLQYVSRRNADLAWPPADTALTLDCVIMRMVPDFDGKGGCCPVFRIYGRDPLLHVDKTPKLLFSTPRRRKNIRYYNQAESEVVKIDIKCHIQGDVVLECISLHDDMKEQIMYRAMFNTAFIKSKILILNRDEIDIYWDAKDHFHKDFRAELLFSEMGASAFMVPVYLSSFEEAGLPMEAFAKVQDMFGIVDWLVPRSDDALNRLHQMPLSDVVSEMLESSFYRRPESRDKRNHNQIKYLDSVGPRSISLPSNLPSTQTSLDASRRSLSSSSSSLSPSMPPHIILTCAHPSTTSSQPPDARAGLLPPKQAGGPPPPSPPSTATAAPPPPPPAPPAPKPPAPPAPPPKSKSVTPASSSNGKVKGGGGAPPPPPSLLKQPGVSAPSPPPPTNKGRRTAGGKTQPTKKLKPLHWSKLNRVSQGSLWAEKPSEDSRAAEFDMSELEKLFSAANPKSAAKAKSRASSKPEIVHLIEHKRSYNCEIMLSKVKIPLHELMDHVLALDDSAMDVELVDNLIKFCPTKEEIEQMKGYKGDKDKLGKCELFFLELMKVPRTEAKLRVFSYKLQFSTQVSDLCTNLNIVYLSVEQIRSSVKLRRILQTILSLGNALNQGTSRGAAVGFRLDGILKLKETRARNSKMTLMHYLCKVLAEKLPELLDFSKELGSLESASKIQLKALAEEMQSITKGLDRVLHEKKMCKKDGHVSRRFRKSLKKFLTSAEGEVTSLASLYSGVGRSVDALILYFGEDPARCPYEQVVSTLLLFVKMFNQAHDENCKKIEAEQKAAEKKAELEKLKLQNHPNNNESKVTGKATN